MSTAPQSPRKSLNKSYLKVKPTRSEIESFKINLTNLLNQINPEESEEHHKTLITKFLDGTYYAHKHSINTKDRKDLVIHNDKGSKSSVGIIIEVKSPSNKAEMPSEKKLNTKAFQELVWYYLQERITGKNLEVKHLVITNVYEWFIFDAQIFDKAFAQDGGLVKQFTDFKEGRLAGKETSFFYKNIAEPAISKLLAGESKAGKEIIYTHFDLRESEKIVHNADKQDDTKLIALYKILSPEHLLKLPFKNDNNTLDKGFYTELLHIIGLVEIKEGSKKIIDRKLENERNEGSILENTIYQLDVLDKLSRVDSPTQFGSTDQEQYFNIGLELTITWINRILFLKLLEAQLITYHKGDKNYSFLSSSKVINYDDLSNLFFSVLAKQTSERSAQSKEQFKHIPYLNSSLFEPTELEHKCFFIGQLQDTKEIPILSTTVLKDNNGKKRSGNISALEYLLAFLDSYDFSSEGSEEIQEENKTLISASVLGLIFEKINGYKDGSFFTPGFITMYMCRETIRQSVVQKFNQVKGWNCETVIDLHNKINDVTEANTIVNSLKICDPAVGSGHFLVSALNELIAIKSELGILVDNTGKSLRYYHIEVSNDELAITDEDGKLFEYNPHNKESQRVQETLFHEKQTLIENCLFGVDINTNSVKICRLRLWIELLKNTYYKSNSNFTELETLPNIDINIKCGNSLVSRFPLDVDLSFALKKANISILEYKVAVQNYRHAASKEQKREMEQLISSIKSNFRSEIGNNDPTFKKLIIKKGELSNIVNQHSLFEISKKEEKDQDKKKIQLQKEVEALEVEVEKIKSNTLFENSLEWRFEFPEILNDNGDFVGFDIIIGNPPYFILTKNNTDQIELGHYLNLFQTIKAASSKNIFNLFIELGVLISNKDSLHSMIVPEGLFETRSYSGTIDFLDSKGSTINITRIEGMVFDEANTGNVIFVFNKGEKDKALTERVFVKNQELKDYARTTNPILSKIESPDFLKLSDICQLFKGMVVADRKNSIFDKPSSSLPNKFLLGNCISKWNIEKYYYTNYENITIVGGTKLKSKYDVSPRILIRRTGDHLCCAYLTEPALTESTLYSCWSIRPDIHNLFVLGVLHSKVANYYIKKKLVTNPQAFPQILMTDLESLPIPEPTTQLHDAIKIETERRLKNSGDNSVIDTVIDELVFQLYGFSEDEIALVKTV